MMRALRWGLLGLFLTAAAALADITGGGGPGLTIAVAVAQITGVSYCSGFTSLAGCYAALPASGGRMVLAANTTYVQSAALNITNNNVIIECPSWNTVIQRGAAQTGAIINFTGAGDAIRDCTIDGNGSINTSGSMDLVLGGANNLGWHVNAINAGGQGAVDVGGQNARLAYSTVTGLNQSNQVYGVWAINHVSVTIDHNTVTNTGIDGIGFDGQGTQVLDNFLSHDHCYTGTSGGAIVAYTGAVDALIKGNTVSTTCATNSYGIENAGANTAEVGNTVINVNGAGLQVDSGVGVGMLVQGNVVKNSGQLTAAPGFSTQAGVSGLTMVGNRFTDDQAAVSTTFTGTVGVGATAGTLTSAAGVSQGMTISIVGAGVAGAALQVRILTVNPTSGAITWNTATSTSTTGAAVTGVATQTVGISFASGTSNNLTVIGNDVTNNTTAGITNNSTGTHQYIEGNPGSVFGPQVFNATSVVGNGADTTEDTLQTYTVPANLLNNVGDRLRFTAGGQFAASTDSKTVRARFGGVNLGSITGSAAGQVAWSLQGVITKTAANTVSVTILGNVLNATTNGTAAASGVSVTLTTSEALIITGQNNTASTANSIIGINFSVEFLPAP